MKVLLATDGSAASQEAEWFLCRVPFPEPVQLTVANVVLVPPLSHMRREFPSSVNEILDEYHFHAETLLAEEAARFEGINGTVETCMQSGHPADVIVQLADERQSDLVVVGARGQSRSQRFLLGSVSQKVARHAGCSVLVTRPTGISESGDRPVRILIAHDGSESSHQAVELLARFHWGTAVEIVVLHVLSDVRQYGLTVYEKDQELQETDAANAEKMLAEAVERLSGSTPHVISRLVRGEHPAEEILTAAEETEADLVVVADRGQSRIQRFLLGSTSQSVLTHAACSVWIVRGETGVS